LWRWLRLWLGKDCHASRKLGGGSVHPCLFALHRNGVQVFPAG
jgi:hypothetical protein